MKTLRHLFVAAVLATGAISAQATVIPLSAFSGSENLINFNSQAPGTISGPFTTQGVTFVAQSGQIMFQSSGGSVIGTTGAALNTSNTTANSDLTLNFATGISRVGFNFGTCSSCGPLSANVIAYDSANNVVESLAFPSLHNSFVGFDFATSVSKVVIDRTDATTFFTFIDDVRFINGGSVPEPSSVALMAIAALAAAFAARRRNV